MLRRPDQVNSKMSRSTVQHHHGKCSVRRTSWILSMRNSGALLTASGKRIGNGARAFPSQSEREANRQRRAAAFDKALASDRTVCRERHLAQAKLTKLSTVTSCLTQDGRKTAKCHRSQWPWNDALSSIRSFAIANFSSSGSFAIGGNRQFSTVASHP
jgi:hypothetical protein